jgi:hypothetical protein
MTTATCPPGYSAITGGVTGLTYGGLRQILVSGPTYSVFVDDGTQNPVPVTAWCALSSQVPITIVDTSLSSSPGYASLACGPDQTPLSASVTPGGPDPYHNDDIYQSGPDPNNTDNWFIEWGATTAQTADVQLLCVPNSALAGASWVFQSELNTSSTTAQRETVTAQCPYQQRMITGGEHVDSLQTTIGTSAPTDGSTWKAWMWVNPKDTLWVSLLCAPAGTPVATFVAGPHALTSSPTATFYFNAVDPAGGAVHNVCIFDGVMEGSCSGSYTVTGLRDGQHLFSIEAVTADARGGASTEKDYPFTVDTTPPTVTLSTLPHFTLADNVSLHASGTDQNGIDYYSFSVTGQSASGSGANPSTIDYNPPSGDLSLPAVTDAR